MKTKIEGTNLKLEFIAQEHEDLTQFLIELFDAGWNPKEAEDFIAEYEENTETNCILYISDLGDTMLLNFLFTSHEYEAWQLMSYFSDGQAYYTLKEAINDYSVNI